MLYCLKLRVVEKPWLGQQKTKEKIRKFRRDKKDRIAIDAIEWQWALASAAKALDCNINVETIRTESGFDAPKTCLFNRKYHHNGKPLEEMFESIREGTVLTVHILVMESGEINGQQYKAPTKEELRWIFDYVGMFIGLSPWGSRWGFGKFEVEDIEQVSMSSLKKESKAPACASKNEG